MTLFAAIAGIGALGLLAAGAVFLRDPQWGFDLTGHEPAALPGVMGGRYLALGAIVLGLLVMGEMRALALALAIGAFLGFLDARLTLDAGGNQVPHLLAGAGSALLAFWCWRLLPAAGA